MEYEIVEKSLENVEDYVRVNALAWKETYQGIVDQEFLDFINSEVGIQESVERQKKKLSLPLKKGLDPQKYGSYSSEQFAYFFVYCVGFKSGGIHENPP